MLKAIINADDFGISDQVNDAITECFRRRYISNTTIMANMPAANAAIELAKENGFFDCVGLHINLREGSPLTEKIKSEPLFCDANGQFHMSLSPLQRYCMPVSAFRKSTQEALREELKAQMEWYLQAGFTQMHMDSHQSVHAWYLIFSAIKPLFDEYGFKTMRLRLTGMNETLPKQLYRSFMNRRIPCNVDMFVDGEAFIENYEVFKREKRIEIMCHPTWDDSKKTIMDMVSGFELQKIVQAGDIQLVSYGNVL